jgi:anti-sigma B factor antagonist
MQLVRSEVDGILVGQVDSSVLTASTAREFRGAIKPLLTHNVRLVLDLSKVDLIDSTGLGALVSCLRQAHAVGGVVKVAGLTKSARALFELVKLHRVFEIFNSTDEAITSYKA